MALNSAAIKYYNYGISYLKSGNYNLAIDNFNKSIANNPNFTLPYYNLAYIYNKENNTEELIDVSKKIIILNPKTEHDYLMHGNSYIQIKQYDNAINCFEKVLKLNSDNYEAKYNLKTATDFKNQQILSINLDKIKPVKKAPESIHMLLKFDDRVSNDVKNKTTEIIDLIWSDPEGNLLLTTLQSQNVQIKINTLAEQANALPEYKMVDNQLTLFGFIPIGYKKAISINISQNYVYDFMNPQLAPHKRFYSFEVFIHEMCHAVREMDLKRVNGNALEEELVSSMIGYNIASRIFLEHELTEIETSRHAEEVLLALIKDEHKDLPLYNNFSIEIANFGIKPPHPYIYQNLAKIYKAIKNEPDFVPLPKLESLE